MSTTTTTTTRARIGRLLVVLLALVLVAGCGESDPGAIGPSGVDGGVSSEQAKEDYVTGVNSALQQLGTAQGQSFGAAVTKGNKRQLQASAIAWRQGVQQLKGLNPPKEAVPAHTKLVEAVSQLDTWNQRIANAAPNKKRTQTLAKQASGSAASRNFEAAVCELVDAGFEVIDPGACTPLANAAGPSS
ncbi:MAG: hypothetical protein KDC46_02365 [Thermoleophilia bacterium]|nr:hypothetical protein [Thermoleophilia bacterium]